MAFQEDSIYWVEVEKVVPNPFQPRREFDEDRLKELSESIRMYGVLQPLTVTRNEVQRDDGTFYTEYELIAGERRLRASRLAGLSQVPVIIREGKENEQEKLELAIIENLQREDLNSVDRALAFQQLAETFGLTHTQVAKKVGRSREYVSNTIRLLGLPAHMLDHLRAKKMTEGHARTLLMLTDRPEEQEVLFREMILKKLSVREVEKIARRIAVDKVRRKDPDEFDDEILDIERKFTESLGTRVQIQKTNFGGKLTIDYFSLEDLEQLLLKVKDERLELGPSIYHKKTKSLNESTVLEIEEEEEKTKEVNFGAFGEDSEVNFGDKKTDDSIPQIRPDNLPKVFEKKEVMKIEEQKNNNVFSREENLSEGNKALDDINFDFKKEDKAGPTISFKTRAEVEEEKMKKEQEERRLRLEEEEKERKEAEERRKWLGEEQKRQEEKRKKLEEEERERLEKKRAEEEKREAEAKRAEEERAEAEERKKREEIRRLEEIARFTTPKAPPEKPKVEELSKEEKRAMAERAWRDSEFGSFNKSNGEVRGDQENVKKEVENNFGQNKQFREESFQNNNVEEKWNNSYSYIEKVKDNPKVVFVSQNKSIYQPDTKVGNYSDGYSSFSNNSAVDKKDFGESEKSIEKINQNKDNDDDGSLYSINDF